MALQDFFEILVYMEKRSSSDGMGGFQEIYVDGAEFNGGLSTNQTMETRIAQRQGVTAIYTIIVPLNVALAYNDVIKRKSDNKLFRVTSNPTDMKTPNMSEMAYYQMTAEPFVIPS